MKWANFFCCLPLIVLLWSCHQSDEQPLDCPDQSDRGLDVLSGPGLFSFEGERFMFLSNEYGGRGKVEEGVGAYPVFLNWEGGCQEEYTVNLLHYSPAEVIPLGWNSVPAPERAHMISVYGLPAGESVMMDFSQQFTDRAPSLPDLVDTIVISGIPSGAPLRCTALSTADFFTDRTNNSVSLIFPETWYYRRFLYVAYQEAVTNNYRAVLIDRSNNRQHYDMTTDGEAAVLQQIHLGAEIRSIIVTSILDMDSQATISTRIQDAHNGSTYVLLPQQSEGYFINTHSDHGNFALSRSDFYDEILTDIQVDDSWAIPLTKLRWIDRDVRFTLERSAYVNLVSRNTDPVGTATFGSRTLRVALLAGDHRLRMPDFPPQFKNRYPEVDLPFDIFKHGYRLEVLHFPAATRSESYYQSAELSWLDRKRYQYYTLTVE